MNIFKAIGKGIYHLERAKDKLYDKAEEYHVSKKVQEAKENFVAQITEGYFSEQQLERQYQHMAQDAENNKEEPCINS
jgi:hypothetical protein